MTISTSCSKRTSDTIIFFTKSIPTSFDPIDYDQFIHHATQSSVLATLITNYQTDRYYPLIAESWHSSNNFMTWTFQIKSSLSFSNGKMITPEDVMNSLKRITLIQKKKHSKNNWTNFLNEFEQLQDLKSNFNGITIEKNNLILHFTKPQPNLLDEISFGTYAIVSPQNYNVVTGEWKTNESIISSYQYEVTNFNTQDKELSLSLRKNISFSDNLKFQHIIISWDDKVKAKSDIIMGDTLNNQANEKYKFYGPLKNGILYYHCLTWKKKDSPFYDINFRKNLRAALYKELSIAKYPLVLSFFPLSINGIQEAKLNLQEDISSTNTTKEDVRNTVNYFYKNSVEEKYNNILFNSAEKAILSLSKIPIKKDLSFSLFKYWRYPDYKNIEVDLTRVQTGILVERPDHDIRFMFLSDEGVKLPDLDGSIHEELEKPNLNYQRINQLLWEQAIIWPITHLSSGIWIDEKRIDLSHYNINRPPIDFTFITVK